MSPKSLQLPDGSQVLREAQDLRDLCLEEARVYPCIQEGGIVLADGAGILVHRARYETKEALTECQRIFYGKNERTNEIEIEQFDPEKHDWPCHCVTPSENYSVEQCFTRVEKVLLENNATVLKAVIRDRFGLTNVEITDLQNSFVQMGTFHGIFRFDCAFTCEGKEYNISLVASVSRSREIDSLVVKDHEALMEIRKAEAEVKGLSTEDSRFDKISNIPKHYGVYSQLGEPSLYLAEFLEGYYEVNFWPHIEGDGDINKVAPVSIMINPANHGANSSIISGEAAEELLSEILINQIALALASRKIISADFAAGDYMLNPETGHLILHCYREFREIEPFPYLIHIIHSELRYPRMRCNILASELTELLFKAEKSLIDGKTFRPYSVSMIVGALRTMLKVGLIASNELHDAILVFRRNQGRLEEIRRTKVEHRRDMQDYLEATTRRMDEFVAELRRLID